MCAATELGSCSSVVNHSERTLDLPQTSIHHSIPAIHQNPHRTVIQRNKASCALLKFDSHWFDCSKITYVRMFYYKFGAQNEAERIKLPSKSGMSCYLQPECNKGLFFFFLLPILFQLIGEKLETFKGTWGKIM